MSAVDVSINSVSASAATAPTVSTTPRAQRRVADYAAVTAAWAVAVVGAAVFPLEDPQVARVALFFHLISMAIGFGAVVMIDVYGLLWLFGYRTMEELVDLGRVAHGVIAVAVGGLLGSGIALQPDLGTPLARFKMLLVLGLMLNGLAAQRMLHGLREKVPPTTRGASIPWTAFQRGLAAALVSQATWWGAIAIGFVTNVQRHS